MILSDTVTHDLKTPLASISGYLELISEQLVEKEYREAEHNTAKALANAGTMLGEINDILKISSIQINEAESYELVDLAEACAKILAKHEFLTKKSKNTIKTILIGDKAACVNKSVLSHVLDNLISNANKFCRDGIITVQVIVEGEVIISVSDEGLAMSQNDLKTFFEPKLSDDSRFTLSGLGLFLCRQRLQKIRGSISARAVTPKGVSVSFKLPNMGR